MIRGATCTLTKLAATATGGARPVDEGENRIETDGFGDFWFESLEVGVYSLEIIAEGFPAKSLPALSTERDLNLGDIPLEPA